MVVATVLSIFSTVQTAPLIFAIIFGVTVFVLVMFVSMKARQRLRSEIESERATRQVGQIRPAEKRAKQWVLLGLVLTPVIVVLSLVAAVSN